MDITKFWKTHVGHAWLFIFERTLMWMPCVEFGETGWGKLELLMKFAPKNSHIQLFLNFDYRYKMIRLD